MIPSMFLLKHKPLTKITLEHHGKKKKPRNYMKVYVRVYSKTMFYINTHPHHMCVYVCGGVCERERQRQRGRESESTLMKSIFGGKN